MNKELKWKKFLTTLILLWAFVFGNLPIINAQDVTMSDDISGGFVFRSSTQKKSAFRNSSSAKRVVTQKAETRKKVKTQVAAVSKTKQRPKPTKVDPSKIDPNLIAKTKSKATPMPKGGKKPPVTPKGPTDAELSNTFAGGAEVYLERGNIDEAVKLFRKAIEFDSKNTDAKLGYSEALVTKAETFTDSENPETATFFYEEAIKQNDKNSVAYVGLAEYYDSIDQNDKALTNYELALKYAPELTELYSPIGILYYQKGEVALAESYLAKAITSSPNSAETQYFLGLVRYKQNRNDEALNAFNLATKLDPNYSEAFYYLGETYDRLNKDKETIEAYKKATTINPKYVDAWFDLGVALYNRGKEKKNTEFLNDAIAAYQKVNQLQGNFNKGEAHANLADVYAELKDYAKANGEYGISVSQNPNDPELLSKYGFSLGRDKKWTRSIEVLNQAVSVKQNDIDYVNLGWAYLNSGRNDLLNKQEVTGKEKITKAKESLQKAVALNPSNENVKATAYLNLGVSLNDLGDAKAAIEALKVTVGIRKNWEFALNELGSAYFAINDLNNAVDQFKRATDINDKFARAFYNLGMSYHGLGNKKEAKKALDKVKKLDANLAKLLEFNLNVTFNAIPGVPNPMNKIPKIPKLPF